MGKGYLKAAFTTLIAAGCTFKWGGGGNTLGAPDYYNNPNNLEANLTINFNSLPQTGEAQKRPWSESYWPSNKGGLAYRWNDPNATDGFSYTPPTLEELRSLSPAARKDFIAKLSPAEKRDILAGRFDYPTVKIERERNRKDHPYWAGICNDWTAAAINEEEGRPVTLTSKDGFEVPFGSSDVNGLMSLAYGGYLGKPKPPIRSLAQRCDADLTKNPELANTPECSGINPKTFHVVLANYLGLQKKPFAANVVRFNEIWNHPVYKFVSIKEAVFDKPSPGAAPGTVKEVVMRTTMEYVVEAQQHWNPILGTPLNPNLAAKTYRYRLELDINGDIKGGAWMDESVTADRPSFLWVRDRLEFTGPIEDIGVIYNASLRPPAPNRPNVPNPPASPPPNAVTPPVSENTISCPGDWVLKSMSQGGQICVKGTQVLGPFTGAMISSCLAQANTATLCNSNQWSEALVNSHWGSNACPRGSKKESLTGYCVEDSSTAFGPFTAKIRKACLNISSEATCNSNRLSFDFVRRQIQ